jgi:MerR family transcriptional regulator, copper efflux regulator
MNIGELARRAGVNRETVRFYERRGLLPAPPRSGAGYRRYAEGDLGRLRFILRAKELGFTLTEIADLLALRFDTAATADDVRARALEKLADADRRIHDLQRIRAALLGVVEACDAHDDVAGCMLIHALEASEPAP